MISVIIPTLRLREDAGWLDRCLAAYEKHTEPEWEPIVIRNRPTCGIAWNEGIKKARGEFIHLTADDVEPCAGWWKPAIETVGRGELPAARILNTDGTLQSCGTDALEHETGEEATIARIPFATREQIDVIGPILPIHYQTDQWFSHRGRECGFRTVVQRDYLFFHHFAQQGRLDRRLARDVREYRRMGGT